MRTTETENQDHKMKGHEDLSITFRPSPNFRHMKKYLKSKFEKENNLNSGNKASESQGSPKEVQEKEATFLVAVQPPLPPNPPPPDSPENTTVKEEIPDEETHNDGYSAENQPEGYQLITEIKTDNPEVEIMCRNFIRGTCTRGQSCIFVHRVIVSQLSSVYQFCNDFQNTVCNFTKCKFVHATVFEKEYFLRTGYLPSHTLTHLKEVNNVSQPPPPPPPAEGIPTQVPSIMNNPPQPPPLLFCHNVAPVPVISFGPAANLETGIENGNSFQSAQPVVISPQKREWSVIDNSNNVQHQQEVLESPHKKCKGCYINDFRVEYVKHKLENTVRASEDIENKMGLLSKKSHKLFTVLGTLIKPLSTLVGNDKKLVNLLAKFLLRDQSMPSNPS